MAGGVLTSTVGHRFHCEGRGWVLVSDLRVGDRLRTPDGTRHAVTGLRLRPDQRPVEVFDLTVDGLHTFYVSADGASAQDLLVHNCTNIVADEGIGGAHTLGQHVRKNDAEMMQKARDTKGGVATRWTDQGERPLAPWTRPSSSGESGRATRRD